MKRFCDTELNDKAWFMLLSCRLKCVVRYLFDKCDSAGVWVPNYTLGALYVGEPFGEGEILEIDGGEQFEKFKNKIFVKGFCAFQYGELKESCNPHRAVIQKLKKYGLYERVLEGYLKGTGRVQDKEKDKDKEEDKEQEQEQEFEKSEKFLIPEMQKIWKQHKPDYPIDKQKDSTPLQAIAKFICEQAGMSYYARDGDITKKIYQLWGTISGFISSHNFFKNYSLIQVEKHIQSITQEIKNGNSKNGKTGGGKVTGEQLNQAFANFYSHEKSH